MREINCLLYIPDTKIVLTIFQDQKTLHVGFETRDPRHDKSCLWHYATTGRKIRPNKK